jgi:hypothetical protein
LLINLFLSLLAGFLTFIENAGSSFDQVSFSFGDHIVVDTKSGCQLGAGCLIFYTGKSYLGLEFSTVLFAFVAHISSFRFMLAQSLTHCSVFGIHRQGN